MNILLVNDDGIEAAGIGILARALHDGGHNVTVVAPESERSAAAHSYTFNIPLTLKQCVMAACPDVRAFKTTGTPCDCVLLGVGTVCETRPDLVLSGINAGANLGTDVPASGTVQAALEGCMQGIPSIALSQEIGHIVSMGDHNRFYESDAQYFLGFLQSFDVAALDGYMISMNFPMQETRKPLKVCRIGLSKNDFGFSPQQDFVGRTYYWVDSRRTEKKFNENNRTDDYWLDRGHVTVSPIRPDLTAHDLLCSLAEQLEK